MKRMMLDPNLCTGCRYCEAVCSLVHNPHGISNPLQARIRIHSDVRSGIDAPAVCRQCASPPCVEACPTAALRQDPATGAILVDPTRCTGCMMCLEVCPFGAIGFDQESGVALICDLCGGDPMCIKFCRALPHIGRAALSYTTPQEYARQRQKAFR